MKTVKAKIGWVYLIGYADEKGAGPVKVGYAIDPRTRLASLQTGGHRNLTLLDKVPGDRESERAFHDALAAVRIEREWFRDGEIISNAFDAVREAMLDVALEGMGPDWHPDLGFGMDELYEERPALPQVIAREVRRSFVYFEYARRTDDWNLDAEDAPPELRESEDASRVSIVS